MRSLYLGNTMIVAQATADYTQVIPDVNNVLSELTVMSCNSVDDVSKAHTPTVHPKQYAPAMRRRIHVCPTFENVKLDEEAVTRDLPGSATGIHRACSGYARNCNDENDDGWASLASQSIRTESCGGCG